MVFAPVSQSRADSEEYWLGLMLDPVGAFFVAVDDQQVIGFLAGKVTQNKGVSFIQSHKVARVNTIVVNDQTQSQGVGRALMKSFNQWAQASGAIELRLEVMEFNQQAQGFYESLGMETQSRTMSMRFEEL
jgi:ribosomal protein S18 acetylase RimI-like enzyme